ncbi:MAG: hypothetical protein E4H03_01255 [Myxococcales bacterium]|nr:MAG: hypothetical protein E4H03_01255 [Myxococcales bacterium]
MLFAINVLVSATVISFASWLSGRFPTTAGFIIALPLATMLVLPLSYVEHTNAETSVALARSIFIAIPVSLMFFLPFLFAGKLGLTFWQAYGIGCAALPVGYLVHRTVTATLIG